MSNPVVNIKYMQAESLAASVNGAWLRAPADGHVSAFITWTGTPTGTLKLEARAAGGTEGEVPGSSAQFTTQPAGAAQATPIICNWDNVPGGEYRITYTRSGSTGTMTINLAQGDTNW